MHHYIWVWCVIYKSLYCTELQTTVRSKIRILIIAWTTVGMPTLIVKASLHKSTDIKALYKCSYIRLRLQLPSAVRSTMVKHRRSSVSWSRWTSRNLVRLKADQTPEQHRPILSIDLSAHCTQAIKKKCHRHQSCEILLSATKHELHRRRRPSLRYHQRRCRH